MNWDILRGAYWCLVLLILNSSCRQSNNQQNTSENLHQSSVDIITFGSCNKHDEPQPLWSPILANKPDLWIWLGDNIYGDTEDMDLMAEKYRLQKQNPQYQKLLADVPVIGTWDDHDYGENNAGKYYPKKEESKALLLDFLNAPTDDPRRNREGVYTAYSYGGGDEEVKVILLDTRYFRDSLKRGENGSIPNETGDILGEQQWEWLEEELSQSSANINIIASSIQVIATQHRSEKWANFPEAKKRLFDLIKKTGAQNVIFISGDRHKAEIAEYEYPGIDYPLYEITSSGLTHSGEVQEPNQFRVGELILTKNFGMMEINWEKDPLEVVLYIKGFNNETFVKHNISYN